MAAHSTSVSRSAVSPLLRFVVDLLYNLFLHQLCSFNKFSTDIDSSSRGSSAVAELLVFIFAIFNRMFG